MKTGFQSSRCVRTQPSHHEPAALDRDLGKCNCFAALVLLLPLSAAQSQQLSAPQAHNVAQLYQDFLRPPDDARPMVRWWWFGVAVQKPEILRELQQMKADGIGGVELAFVYPQVLNDPSRGLENLPFLSPRMLERCNLRAIGGAQTRPARRRHPMQRLALRWSFHHAQRRRWSSARQCSFLSAPATKLYLRRTLARATPSFPSRS